LRTIGGKLYLQAIEYLLGKAKRIGGRLQHERRHCADQRRLGIGGGEVGWRFSDRDAPSGIVGLMVHIMAVGSLDRAATMATAVMGDNAIATMEEEQQLRVPIIGRQRPAVPEHNRLPEPQSL
jgi:hypothetical protein